MRGRIRWPPPDGFPGDGRTPQILSRSALRSFPSAEQRIEHPSKQGPPVEQDIRLELHVRFERQLGPVRAYRLALEGDSYAIRRFAQQHWANYLIGLEQCARYSANAATRKAKLLERKRVVADMNGLTRADEADCACRHKQLSLQNIAVRHDRQSRHLRLGELAHPGLEGGDPPCNRRRHLIAASPFDFFQMH